MILGRVIGTVVSTRKDEKLSGSKLLVVRATDPRGKDEAGYVIAVDTVNAGVGDRVHPPQHRQPRRRWLHGGNAVGTERPLRTGRMQGGRRSGD